jgi:hypothetical protein
MRCLSRSERLSLQTTDAITRTFTTVFFIASHPDVLSLLRRCWPALHRQLAETDTLYQIERLLHRRRLIQRWRDWSNQTHRTIRSPW